MNRHARLLTPAALAALLALAACGGDPEPPTDGDRAGTAGETAAPEQRALPAQDYPPEVETALETALAAYEEVRALLAGDRLEGLAARSSRLAQALRLAADGAEAGSPAAADLLDEAARTAASLAEAADLAGAREAFAELSRTLIPVVGADPGLAAGRKVYACPMVEGFDRWIQPEGRPENPFMGEEMLRCAEDAEWRTEAPATQAEVEAHADYAHGGAGGDEIAFYTCSMHPSVRSKDPGQCPICNMKLVPVTRAEVESGTILVLYHSRLIPAAHDQVRAALAGFETGQGSFLDLIEAERNQRTVELEYEETLADSYRRRAELARALGTWPPAAGPPADQGGAP
jgi:hypothetical protein